MDEPIPVDQAARAEQQRLQSEAEAAAQAQVLFRTGSAIAPASGPLPVGGDLAAARFPAVPPASSVQNDDYAQQNRQADKRAFVAAEPDSRTYGSAELHMPRSRSEEHTSELQSLMRISYAVFCLKKKKQQTIQPPLVKY